MSSLASSPVSLELGGVSIKFPYAPYECQRVYMAKVVLALKTGKNALLESPTGTGKTMAVLCATLGWQTQTETQTANHIKLEYAPNKAEINSMNANSSSVSSFPSRLSSTASASSSALSTNANPPSTTSLAPGSHKLTGPAIIIYASRTHAQLQQVVQELKKSTYRPRVAVLGSRDQLCVNSTLLERGLKGQLLDQACNSMCVQYKCHHRTNLDRKKGREAAPCVMDIEEAVAYGKRTDTCPYFLSREAAVESADLVLMPYNYLLDSAIRSSLKMEWKRVVVVFDEAHNLEDAAASAASFSFSTHDLSACVKELQNASTLLNGSGGPTQSSSNLMFTSNTTGAVPTIADVSFLIKIINDLENRIHILPLSAESPGVLSKDMEGAFLLDMCTAAQFSFEKIKDIIAAMRRCVELLLEASITTETVGNGSRLPVQPKLVSFCRCLEQLFKTYKQTATLREVRMVCSDYRLYVREEENIDRKGYFNLKQKRTVNFWAFCGGVAMDELRELGIRSMIMTSGTLAPLDSFKDDMKIPFDICLENEHVIGDGQLWAGAIPAGPANIKLNSSFSSRDNDDYKDEVGNSLLTICRSMAIETPGVPRVKGGILAFFSSYTAIQTLVDRWKMKGLFVQLERACGQVVVETGGQKSKSKGKFLTKDKATVPSAGHYVAKRISSNANDDSDCEDEIVAEAENVLNSFNAALHRHQRCLLLAVCRGKVSEGIDFKDSRARAVVVVGIPFAPFKDPWVVLKMKYLDQRHQETAQAARTGNKPRSNSTPYGNFFGQMQPVTSVVSNLPPRISISGRDWYNQAAVRAVNQAIGRIIRHRRDWGAVYLLDERFSYDSNLLLLSRWVRAKVKKCVSFGAALDDCRSFFTSCLSDLNLETGPKTTMTVSLTSSERSSVQQFKRKVELSESDIVACEVGTVYLDPRVLLSQNISAPPSRQSIMSGNLNVVVSSSRQLQPSTTLADVFSKPRMTATTSKPLYSSTVQVKPVLNTNERSKVSRHTIKADPSQFQTQTKHMVAPSSTRKLSGKWVNDLPVEINSKPAEETKFGKLELASYVPSKRAKLMSTDIMSQPQLSQGSSSTGNLILAAALAKGQSINKPRLSFEIVSSKGIQNIPPSSQLQQNTGTQRASIRFGCLVCNTENLVVRGAARCGHVCCIDCWTKWLNKSSTCPSCRLPTSLCDIAKLSIKESS